MPDIRSDVDSYRRSLVLGANQDVALASDDGGRLTIGGIAVSGYTTVASATALPLPTARVVRVTGTVTITSITSTAAIAGQIVTLIFSGILTFTDGSNLKLAGDMTTSADDTITLAFDGTNWSEVCRSVN